MSLYEPGEALVAYDVVPPLQYKGFDAYKKDYQEFLDHFQGPVDIEYHDLAIFAGDTIAFSRGLGAHDRNIAYVTAYCLFTVGNPDVFDLDGVTQEPAPFRLASVKPINGAALIGKDLLQISNGKRFGGNGAGSISETP